MTGFKADVVAMIVVRDLGCCVRCGSHVAHLERGRDWAIHHRRPRGAGGTSVEWVNRAANGVVLCTACHGWIESHRTAAIEAGWLISQNGRLRAVDVPLTHVTLGRVFLTDEGSWVSADGPTEPDAWMEKVA